MVFENRFEHYAVLGASLNHERNCWTQGEFLKKGCVYAENIRLLD